MSATSARAAVVGAAILWLSTHLVAIDEVTFRCDAGDSKKECAFSVEHPDQTGRTDFVLANGATHGLTDQFAGSRYCVSVDVKGKAQNKWPECWEKGGSKRVQRGTVNK